MYKVNMALKEIYEPVDIIDKTINPNKGNTNCESTPNPAGQGEALPAPSKETCNRSHEGFVTHAVVAISVGAVIGDHPHSEMFING